MNSAVAGADFAASNPFGSSAKYTDSETGLVYYGYRYYDPSNGRWKSRDPIEEVGGKNLYCFVVDSPVNLIDGSGLVPLLSWKTEFKPFRIDPSKTGGAVGHTEGVFQGQPVCRQCNEKGEPRWQLEGVNVTFTISMYGTDQKGWWAKGGKPGTYTTAITNAEVGEHDHVADLYSEWRDDGGSMGKLIVSQYGMVFGPFTTESGCLTVNTPLANLLALTLGTENLLKVAVPSKIRWDDSGRHELDPLTGNFRKPW